MNAKEEVRRILDTLPDDATLEDIQYHIFVQEKVRKGLKDIDSGKTLSQEEVEKRMQRWLAR